MQTKIGVTIDVQRKGAMWRSEWRDRSKIQRLWLQLTRVNTITRFRLISGEVPPRLLCTPLTSWLREASLMTCFGRLLTLAAVQLWITDMNRVVMVVWMQTLTLIKSIAKEVNMSSWRRYFLLFSSSKSLDWS